MEKRGFGKKEATQLWSKMTFSRAVATRAWSMLRCGAQSEDFAAIPRFSPPTS